MTRPALNHYVLDSLRVVACEYPHHPEDADLARAKRAVLAAHGVTYILDLTEFGELDPWPEDSAWRPTRHRFPIRDVGVPTSVAAFDDAVEQVMVRLAQGEVVAVHCWGGVGRTGMMTAALLIRRGWSVDDALLEVNRLWRATPKAALAPHRHRTAPETEAQRAFVREWAAA